MAVSVFYFATIALVIVVLANGAVVKNTLSTEQKIKSILKPISADEKREFIRYHLQKGHELLKEKQDENYPSLFSDISDDESILLYEYYLTNNLITDENTIKSVQNVICWGTICLDIADPGIHP